MGGLSKKATLLKKLATSAEVLKIDAGALFFDAKLAGQPQRLPHALITAEAMVASYNRMGYDAVAVAGQDLAAGAQALRKLAAQASFPLLSANLVGHDGALLFKPMAHLERAGLRIALIGLTGHPPAPAPLPAAVRIAPWREVLPPILSEIAAHHDLVILLSSLSAAENRAIAEEMPAVHILVQAGAARQNMAPQLINNTLLLQTGPEGKYQGRLTIQWTASQKWQQEENPLLTLQKEYDRLGWLIDRVRKKGGPAVVYQGNAAKQKDFLETEARHRELAGRIREMAAKEDEQTPAATYAHHFVAMPPELADDVEIAALLREARQQANQLRRERGVASQRFRSYTGSLGCRSCHESQYQAWAQTPHAAAYATLADKDQNHNPNCVFCHVTGIDEETAHLEAMLPEHLKAVGCEACHGPGRQHAADPRLSPPPFTPGPDLCGRCHTAERDDTFNYAGDIKKVH